jgi:hypothetical protein
VRSWRSHPRKEQLVMQSPLRQVEVAIRDGEPPDLWTRLARLNGRCRSSLESCQASPLFEGSLYWQMTIRLRGQPPDSPFVSIVRARAADAIAESLEEAEARGWHRPAGVLPV